MHTILPLEKNPFLREVSRELSNEDVHSPRITKLIAEMKKLLAKEEFGVALAAVQVGEPLRLFIVSGRALSRGARNSPDSAEATSGKPDVPHLEARSSKLPARRSFGAGGGAG